MSVEERYVFTASAKKKLGIFALSGLVLLIIGIILTMNSGHNNEGGHGMSSVIDQALASSDNTMLTSEEGGEHSGTAIWLKRLFVDIWINNIYFLGIALIGIFFVAFQYAAQAGWSAGVKRVPEAYGHWLPVAAVLTIAMFFVAGHDIFHWTHTNLYDPESSSFDRLINGKKAYFFWPLHENPGFPIFYVIRMVFYFVVWYWLFMKIRNYSLKEDIEGGTGYWRKIRSISAYFLIVFAVTSSTSAWDFIMSIDIHWFSTMFGWYTFASWFVTGLATIILMVVYLKDLGYLSVVNSNHMHDLGKFMWAFSIFWTYLWFSQFLLIYYANIPEESIYFIERITSSNYAWIFYLNLIMNFFFPFLLLMTRDAKRHTAFLKVVCPIVLVGHWFDFYLMITPGTMNQDGGFGFMEIGMTMIFAAGFLFVVFSNLAKVPLVAKNHPMLEESLHHHI